MAVMICLLEPWKKVVLVFLVFVLNTSYSVKSSMPKLRKVSTALCEPTGN